MKFDCKKSGKFEKNIFFFWSGLAIYVLLVGSVSIPLIDDTQVNHFHATDFCSLNLILIFLICAGGDEGMDSWLAECCNPTIDFFISIFFRFCF